VQLILSLAIIRSGDPFAAFSPRITSYPEIRAAGTNWQIDPGRVHL
jgi:hypothetical protein